MSNIYGGDEVNALVVDLGSHSCKAGYAGDDAPKALFPGVVGVHAGSVNDMEVDGDQARAKKLSVGYQALSTTQQSMEVVSPFGSDDLYSDWDAVEALYSHAFKDRLSVKPEEFAMLLAEPTHNTRACREKLVEIMFEKFNVPALFLAKNAVLSCFSVARQTSLVVDSGHCGTTVAAVHDGYVLQNSITRTPIAGSLLTRCMAAVATAKGFNIQPRFAFKRQEVRPGEFKVNPVKLSGITDSFRQYHVDQILADVKESLCRTSDGRFNEADNASIPTVSYELPDGQEIQLGMERFKLPEVFFQPALLNTFQGLQQPAGPVVSLPEAVFETIGKCDVDVRKDMYAGAVLTGGSSLMNGLRDRLERELSDMAPAGAKVKVLAQANTIERRYSVWIGGSIMASLGSFQQLWMSKKEYQEHGAPMINRKCP